MTADKEREVLEAWRAVANAKLVEYRRQAWRLAGLVRQGAIEKVDAVDGLWEIAIAHALLRSLGEDRVQAIIAEAFAGTDCGPMQHAEVSMSEPTISSGSARKRLPNRRSSETISFCCGNFRYAAEIFLNNNKAGSDSDSAAKVSAVVVSIALQYGVPLDTIRRVLLRDPRGVAASPLGVALDICSHQ